MNPSELLSILSTAEKLKCTTRHCYTSSGRKESVAEHSWRLALMAMLISHEDEFCTFDMAKVIKMCLIHDLGEAFTGDIPTFLKTASDTRSEESVFSDWIESFPASQKQEFNELLTEMSELSTKESQLYKALDKMEAVIQHNESDIATWLPLEYDLQLTYGTEEVNISEYTKALKSAVDIWTKEKISNSPIDNRQTL